MRNALILLFFVVFVSKANADGGYVYESATGTLTYTNPSITTLSLPAYIEGGQAIKKLDISRCTNLTSLYFSEYNLFLREIVASNTRVGMVNCECAPALEKLHCRNCTNLQEVRGLSSTVDSLDLSGCSRLSSINLSNLQIKTLDLSSSVAMITINITDCPNLSDLKLPSSLNSNITTFVCSNTAIDNLMIKGFNKLKKLNINNNPNLKSITFPLKNSSLSEVELKNIPNVEQFNLTGMIIMKRLTILNCKRLTTLTLPTQGALESIICDSTQLVRLDMTNLPRLSYLELVGSPTRLENSVKCTELQWYTDQMGRFCNNPAITTSIDNERWGTICCPRPLCNYKSQFTAYTTMGKMLNSSYLPSAVGLSEVKEDTLKAGVPYVVLYKNDTIQINTGDEIVSSPINTEGLKGSFVKSVVPAGMMYLSNNKLYITSVASTTLLAYHAYIDVDAMETIGSYENNQSNSSAVKYMLTIDNKTVGIEENIIKKDNGTPTIYDAHGRPVKETKRGHIYIINGQRVIAL